MGDAEINSAGDDPCLIKQSALGEIFQDMIHKETDAEIGNGKGHKVRRHIAKISF